MPTTSNGRSTGPATKPTTKPATTTATKTVRTKAGTAKTATARRGNTAVVDAKATTKVGTVQADAVVDLARVRKPFYAYVGVADLAVATLRTLPVVYSVGVQTAQSQVNSARGSVKTLPVAVLEQLTSLPDKAKGTYADLAKRGEKLVKTVRNNPNTQVAVAQAKTARSQAKGAATSLRRSTSSAEKVASATASKIG
jgi:hypothetical protein